jgi:RES domain-containing protein
MIIWRISNYADLSGRGGQLAPGRWHDQGVSVIYCCDHPSTTLLEILVQIDHCPDDIRIFDAPIAGQDMHDIGITRRMGSQLLSENNFCLIRVPSAILPEAMNILINPRHPDAGRLTIEKAIRYPFDSRLFR